MAAVRSRDESAYSADEACGLTAYQEVAAERDEGVGEEIREFVPFL